MDEIDREFAELMEQGPPPRLQAQVFAKLGGQWRRLFAWLPDDAVPCRLQELSRTIFPSRPARLSTQSAVTALSPALVEAESVRWDWLIVVLASPIFGAYLQRTQGDNTPPDWILGP